eukprot:1160027-Pelagomonas_calceolata.AAC.6
MKSLRRDANTAQIIAAGRRPHFYVYNVEQGKVERVQGPSGCPGLKSLESFAAPPASCECSNCCYAAPPASSSAVMQRLLHHLFKFLCSLHLELWHRVGLSLFVCHGQGCGTTVDSSVHGRRDGAILRLSPCFLKISNRPNGGKWFGGRFGPATCCRDENFTWSFQAAPLTNNKLTTQP